VKKLGLTVTEAVRTREVKIIETDPSGNPLTSGAGYTISYTSSQTAVLSLENER